MQLAYEYVMNSVLLSVGRTLLAGRVTISSLFFQWFRGGKD
ncbi:MAG: hypothetical protein QXF52_04060 [Thermoproteota archaeon]